MSHTKSYTAPRSWNVLRKHNTFLTNPAPGAHPHEYSLPLTLVLRQLNLAQTVREIKSILRDKLVEVDGKPITDHHFTVGIFDTILIKPDTTLRCTIDTKGRLVFKPCNKDELNKKICKIIGKQTTTGGKIQLSLSSGRTILADNKDYTVGDSLVIELPSQKIIEHIKLAKGNTVFLIGGSHTGNTATISSIEGNRIFLDLNKEAVETRKQLAFVVGTTKPTITL